MLAGVGILAVAIAALVYYYRNRKNQRPSKPIHPHDFTPHPTTPSTFPSELAHLYHDPAYTGKGGFARVFKAKRKTDNQTVAVKIPISLDEGTGRSFLREITSWQRLKHKNIITLYDANILPIPYLEMEYADSGSLDQMNKPVSVETASEIILEIAEGLAYSHAQGVIHRDLKPMNILLTKDFTPKISDWGLSKIIAENKTSSVYGFSPFYASPEQISKKKFGKPDERTDIYQLGVVFYELLAGRPPFEGNDLVEVSTAIATEKPAPPSELNQEAEIVDPIILKCLAKKKEDRYQNVGELRSDLASIMKIQLKKSLKTSVNGQNMKRSAFYCAELCLLHAKLGEIEDVVTYLTDMRNYASEGMKTEVVGLLEELRLRKDMASEEKISEGFIGRLKNLLHQVRMGR
ncbi:MAG: Serine/threonine-protein kinase PknD [Candidatus Argoarchaeum ethanivorans]|uniref:Serine/threonine-protein kinase PknD n=1 Tax=Candidatus Argoarchaeum ethanivorans TaxID=2608793 RepID=A0A811THG2_9EURY|nr:MAG: Serine/threonine-protein kinase PknD [Candidatus Argoarchaeum ethanivorans]